MKSRRCTLILELIIVILLFVGVFTYLVIRGNQDYNDQLQTLKTNTELQINRSINNFINQLTYSASTLEHYINFLNTKYFPIDVFYNITLINDIPLRNAITAIRFSPLIFDFERQRHEDYGKTQLYPTYELLNSNFVKEANYPYYMPFYYITPPNSYTNALQPAVNMFSNAAITTTLFDKITSLNSVTFSDEVIITSTGSNTNKGIRIGILSANRDKCDVFIAESFDDLIAKNNNGCINGISIVIILAQNLVKEIINANKMTYINDFMIFNSYTNSIIYKPSIYLNNDISSFENTHQFNIVLDDTTKWTIMLIFNDIKFSNYLLIIYITIPTIFGIIITTLIIINILTKKRLLVYEETISNINYIMSYVNHEIRDPLNTISGCSFLLGSKLKHMLDNQITLEQFHQNQDSIISDMYTIIRASKLIEYYIRDILDMQKLERNKLEINNKIISLGQIANEIKKSLIYTINEHEHHIRYVENIFDKDYKIYIDNIRIEQILCNFLLNSFKFTINGAVKLTIEEKKDDILFKVEDTGIGINPDIQKQIFNVKYIGREMNMYGLGIGLYLCKQIANLLKCDIGFASNEIKENEFSTMFYIKFKKSDLLIPEDVELEII